MIQYDKNFDNDSIGTNNNSLNSTFLNTQETHNGT